MRPRFLCCADVHVGRVSSCLNSPTNVDLTTMGALKSAGLPEDIRVHDLRHATASLMIAKGVDLKVVSDQLGHLTIRLTADTYIHTVEKTKREAAAKMQELFN